MIKSEKNSSLFSYWTVFGMLTEDVTIAATRKFDVLTPPYQNYIVDAVKMLYKMIMYRLIGAIFFGICV